MNIEENNPTVLITPSRQGVEVFDPSQEDGIRHEEDIGLKLDLHQYANILGVLATRGVGEYTDSEIARAAGLETSSLKGRGEVISKWLPSYISYDRGFRVLQDFSVAVAPEQPGDADIIRAKKRAASAQRRQEKLEARQRHIDSLKGELDQLVAEAIYASEDIEQFDTDKTNLYEFDSVRATVDGQWDIVVPLIDAEDLVCARILMELSNDEGSKLDILAYDDKAQSIWDAMPNAERVLFANTYRKEMPNTFKNMFTSVAGELSREGGLTDGRKAAKNSEREFATRTMKRIDNVTLFSEEPTDDDYVEFSVKRYDKSNFAELRHRQWMEDKARRKSLVAELRSMGVFVDEHIKPVRQKKQLTYTPESQIDMKAPLAELITNILNGGIIELSQPQAMDIVYAANNARYYRAIEGLGAKLEDPMSLDKAVEILNEAARMGLGDTYHGFAVRERTIGLATVKRLHRR